MLKRFAPGVPVSLALLALTAGPVAVSEADMSGSAVSLRARHLHRTTAVGTPAPRPPGATTTTGTPTGSAGNGSSVAGSSASGTASPGSPARTLAFTGLDVWKVLAVGGLLVGCAAGTSRLARRVG
jgi:hypothetical protein